MLPWAETKTLYHNGIVSMTPATVWVHTLRALVRVTHSLGRELFALSSYIYKTSSPMAQPALYVPVSCRIPPCTLSQYLSSATPSSTSNLVFPYSIFLLLQHLPLCWTLLLRSYSSPLNLKLPFLMYVTISISLYMSPNSVLNLVVHSLFTFKSLK